MTERVQNKMLGALDPDVKVPDAVRRAAARANAAYEQPENPENSGNPGENDDGTLKIVDGQAQPAPQPQPKPVPRDNQPGRNPEREEKGALGRERQQFEARERQLQDALRDRERRVGQLEAMIIANTPIPTNPNARNPLVTAEERESYGDELLNVAAKAAREQIDPELEQLRREVQQLRSTIGVVGVSQQLDARDRMFATMDTSLPGWRDQNANPEFLSWLGLPDAYSGVIREKLLKNAFDANDANRVIAFFRGFRQEQATVDPAVPQPHPTDGRVPLATFAAPGRAKSAAAPAPAETNQSFTPAQIKQFYADVNAGKYRNNEVARARTEAAIFDAQSREGGIRRE